MHGIHVSKTSKLTNIKRATIFEALTDDISRFNLNAAQIFTHGPRNRKKNAINYDAIKKWCHANKVYLVVHSSYPTASIWNVTKTNEHTRVSQLSINHVAEQLASCASLGAAGLVVHIPVKTVVRIAETMSILEPFVKKTGVPIYLEIESRKPSNLTYETPECLDYLCDVLNKTLLKKSWGICVDTAHLWASEYDISTKVGAKRWIDNILYQEKIKLIHLNGSSTPFGCSKDVHEIAFSSRDKIWGNQDVAKTGAYTFIKFAKKNNIPLICEINRGNHSDATRLFDLL